MIQKNFKTRAFAFLIFWVLFFVVDVLKKSAFSRDVDGYLLYYYLPGFLVWYFLTFPAFWVFQRSKKFSWYVRGLVLLLGGITIGSAKALISWSGFYFLAQSAEQYEQVSKVLNSFYFVEATIIAWILFILFFINELYAKYQVKSIQAAELESLLTKSELQNLKMQLQPHFLFNAHNTIAMLIRMGENEKAVQMLTALSDLLRSSLNREQEQMLSLEQEIEFLKKYLSIEQIRFQDTLDVQYEIDSLVKNYSVPALILQPLVENAFKHGVSKRVGETKICIKANKGADDKMAIEISNNGPGLEEEFDIEKTKGVGLKNTLERLKKIYNGRASLELSNTAEGVKAQMIIPKSE